MRKRTSSLYLGKLAGTAIYLHWSFLLLIFFVFFSTYKENGSWNQGILAILFILSVFACITLHELGHIVVSRRYGYPAKSITLYPIGGIANLERIPDKPYQEFWMALAGPWVNIIIAAALFVILSWKAGAPQFGAMRPLSETTFLFNLMVVNITLAIFNLIPAFPMDGGRVIRSLLSAKMDRVRATRIAARLGQIIAIGFIVVGLFFNWWLVIIGFLIIVGASAEAALEINRAVMAKHTVNDVLMTRFTLLRADDTVEKVMQDMLNSQEKEFVVDNLDGTYSTLTSADVVNGLQSNGSDQTVGAIMNRTVHVLNRQTPLEEAYHKMMVMGYKICPVIEDGQLIGTLDMGNINEFIAFKVALNKDMYHARVLMK